MSPEQLKKTVLVRAGGLCEYCKSPANISSQAFSMDHIIPKSKGGKTEPGNLALSCQGCNNYKYNKSEGIDELTGLSAPIFNPRKERWNNHFSWSEDGTEILGISAIGRVTVKELQLNRMELRNLRSLLVDAGIHPPSI